MNKERLKRKDKAMKAFSTAFADAKKRNKLTYKQISKSTKIPVTYLCAIALGKKNTNLRNALLISKNVGFKLDTLH